MRGAFITLEGIEGVGKSTNMDYAVETLRARGKDVIITREPGGTDLGERIRTWVLNADHGGALSPEVETLLMFAARAHHLERVIRPALESGRWVVCDRFTDATFAYQGGGRGVAPQLLQALRDNVQRGLEPDLTLLLDAPLEIGFGRISHRSLDHFERENRAFFERVRAGYLDIAARDSRRVRIVDAARPLEDVRREIARHLAALIESHG